MTDFVHPYSLIPPVGDPDGRVLTCHAATGKVQPSGVSWSLTGQTPLLVALFEHDGTDADAPTRAYNVADLSASAMPDGREGAEEGSRVLEV